MSFNNLRHKRHIVFTSMKKEVISSFAQVKITFTGHAIIPQACVFTCMYISPINHQNGPLTKAVIVVYINNSVFS